MLKVTRVFVEHFVCQIFPKTKPQNESDEKQNNLFIESCVSAVASMQSGTILLWKNSLSKMLNKMFESDFRSIFANGILIDSNWMSVISDEIIYAAKKHSQQFFERILSCFQKIIMFPF